MQNHAESNLEYLSGPTDFRLLMRESFERLYMQDVLCRPTYPDSCIFTGEI